MTDHSHPSPDEALIDELTKLHEAATPGPWSDASNGWGGVVWRGPIEVGLGYVRGQDAMAHQLCEFQPDDYPDGSDDEEETIACSERDAELVVAMRNALPTLLTLARSASEAKARLERLESALEFLRSRSRGIPLDTEDALKTATKLGWTGKAGT